MGRKPTSTGRKCAFCDRWFTRNEHLLRHQRNREFLLWQTEDLETLPLEMGRREVVMANF